MANVSQEIYVGSGAPIGNVAIDASGIRGDGGPSRPRLVVPVALTLYQRPWSEQIAITGLRVHLAKNQQAFEASEVCSPVNISLVYNMPARSLANELPNRHNLEIHIPLTQAEIVELEKLRRNGPADAHAMTLYARIDPEVAGLANYGEHGGAESPWGMTMGIHSQFAVFWNPRVEVLPLTIQREIWIEKILPGLGYERLRLIEVTLPPPLPDHVGAAAEFDRASAALQRNQYRDCTSACRGVIRIWEKTFNSSKERPVARVVAERLGWAKGDRREQFVDGLWKTALDFANLFHHPEGQADIHQPIDDREARLLFFVVSALCEYMGPLSE